MKKLIFAVALLIVSLCSYAQSSTYVNGYTRSNGTYVQGYYRTTPNSTRNDNYSTIGNINPYTGVAGTKPGDSYYTPSNSSYSTPGYSSNSYSLPSYSTTICSCPCYSTYSIPSAGNSSLYSAPTYYSTYSIPSYSTASYPSSSIYSSPINSSNYTIYSH